MDATEHLKRGPDHDVAGRGRIDGEIQPSRIDVLAGITVGRVAEGGIEGELSLDRLPAVERNPTLEGGQQILGGTPLPLTDLSNFQLSQRPGD